MKKVETIETIEKEAFYGPLLKVAIPVMLQQLIIVAVGICDTIMVGKISETALAAVGAANQVYMVYMNCIFGFLAGVSVFAVQYWGIGDMQALRRMLGIGYAVVAIVGIPVTAVVYVWAPQLISVFSNDAEVILVGADYLRIAVFTYFIGAITFVISYNSRVISKLFWPTVFNALAVAINIFLNWCLIFGKCGMPEMGVRGAALATLIARIIECILTVGYIYVCKDHPLRATLEDMKFERDLLMRVLKIAMPVVLNEFLWVLSFTATFAIYGRISPTALAVTQVAMTITNALQAIYFGLGNGCAVIVGSTLGTGDREGAYKKSVKCVNIAWILNILLTVVLIFVRQQVIAIYDFEPATNTLLYETLFVYALAITPRMLGYLIICGILRPGGDTTWAAVADAGINWVIQVPLAILAVSVFKMDLPAAVAIVVIADAIKAVVVYIRLLSKKWLNVFTGR